MGRRFNVSGECNPADHYMLAPTKRLPRVWKLVENKAYFILHAPRQSGKSTTMHAFARELTREGRYTAAFVSAEVGAPLPSDVGMAELALLDEWRRALAFRLPPELQPPPWPDAPPASRLTAAFRAWANASVRPLVVFIDEIDALRDETLVSVLRQLRSAFADRPGGFPSSVALIGLRDVRDYVIQAGGSGRVGSSSPFNIKDESLTLRNFTRDEVAELYLQHTADTGQVFEPDAIDRAAELTGGHPWLVNALARQLVEVLVPEPSKPITRAKVDEAKEILIERRDTHLDSLAAKLREPRVRAVLEPMLVGTRASDDVLDDDFTYVRDLGLVAKVGGVLEIANPIYREIVPRVLSVRQQEQIREEPAWYVRPDGGLDMPKLLAAFQEFWRTDGHLAAAGFFYREAGPHLMLQAFLQRILNGGGQIEREYALGRGALDLLVRWKDERYAIEVKVRRDRETLAEGLRQISRYLDGAGLKEGWLVIIDKRKLPWKKKLYRRDRKVEGRKIHLMGL